MAKFVKGQSGNPSGRPKVIGELRDLARGFAPEGIKILQSIASDVSAPHAARVSAVKELFDRGFGKPAQSIEHTGADGGPIKTEEVSKLEIARRVAFLLASGAEVAKA